MTKRHDATLRIVFEKINKNKNVKEERGKKIQRFILAIIPFIHFYPLGQSKMHFMNQEFTKNYS